MESGFSLYRQDPKSKARLGLLETPHGTVETPIFCPVGTAATVKGMTPRDLSDLRVQMLLCNAYHLYLRPGYDQIKRMGGLHRFMGWDGPILTDSGGYQIRSLSRLCKVTQEGVGFRSHIDGSSHFFTPERAMEVQTALGSDIQMVFDECLPYPSTEEAVASSLTRTSLWARQSRDAFEKYRQDLPEGKAPLLFGIVQGGIYDAQRRRSVEELVEIGFVGYAVGGLSVGEPIDLTLEILDKVTEWLPDECPRYLMGVGRPEDLVEGVARGVDIFDCVMPTRHARTGELFTSFGRLVIKHTRYQEDKRPVDEECGCYTCRHFTRAYLRHLFVSHEILGIHLNTYHNLYYYINFMRQLRDSVKEGKFSAFRERFYAMRREAN